MSARKVTKMFFVSGSTVASKKGASLLVERLELTPAGVSALTTTAKSIGNGNHEAAKSTDIPDLKIAPSKDGKPKAD